MEYLISSYFLACGSSCGSTPKGSGLPDIWGNSSKGLEHPQIFPQGF